MAYAPQDLITTVVVVVFLIIVIGVLIRATVKILREYERGVVFTLGRFQKVKGPGFILLVPFVALVT